MYVFHLAFTLREQSSSLQKSSWDNFQGCFGKLAQEILQGFQKLAQISQLTKLIQIIIIFNKLPQLFTTMTETKKAHDVFEKTKGVKGATLSHVESQVGSALIEAVNHLDAENKKIASSVIINKVQEVTYDKDKSFILIYIGYRTNKILLTPAYKKLVTQLEKRLKKTVLVLSARRIQSRWVKQNRKLQKPNSRTLQAVYSAILDELLLPGIIIGFRTRVRLDGTSFSKVTLDKTEQHFLEDRVGAIRAAYRKLTTRDIQIDFQKEGTFYTLKKGEKR